MEAVADTLKPVATLAAPLVAAVVETHLKPKLEHYFKRRKSDADVLRHTLANHFQDYLTDSYATHSFIRTVVFQNRQKALDELYVPLTLTYRHGGPATTVDEYPKWLLETYRKLLISDTAGMGKSTLLKYILLTCVRENAAVPVFIELRHLATKNCSLLELIYERLNPIDDTFDRGFIERLIKRGDFLFLLDGYDEISPERRAGVTEDVREFISKAGKNLFVMASRPETALASFPDFRAFKIRPLSDDESYALLRNYDPAGQTAEALIEAFADPRYVAIRDFLGNPLLVSLLFRSYDYKRQIPIKKHIFYRQVYDSLYESHDLTKGDAFVHHKYSELDIDSFHRLLRGLGFITLKEGATEYDTDQILAFLREAKALLGDRSVGESQVLRDLTVTVPLFLRDGDYCAWGHRSLQDYFAAGYVCYDAKERQGDILSAMVESHSFSRYENVLDLSFAMDEKSFRIAVLRRVYESLIRFNKSSYVQVPEFVLPQATERRRRLSFGRYCVFLPAFAHIASAVDAHMCRHHEGERYRISDTFEGRGFMGVLVVTPVDMVARLLHERGSNVVPSQPVVPLPQVLERVGRLLDVGRVLELGGVDDKVLSSHPWFDLGTDLLACLVGGLSWDPGAAEEELAAIQRDVEFDERSVLSGL